METILSSTSHNPPIDPEDALAIALVRWFKTSFMQWVDPVKCPKCHGTTEGSGTLLGNDITSMEKTGGAGRVEIYNCIEIQKDGTRGCKGTKRFPRYK
jgi:peptide-N4-(N-acetyl-beta-glucosaminyl)asparagine amidase